jgi:OOP family OmpA-OmpF porin
MYLPQSPACAPASADRRKDADLCDEFASRTLVILRLSVGILLVCLSLATSAQNLVPNSGFEEYTTCPKDYLKFGETLKLPGWYSPTLGTPDYYNECSPWHCKASDNWAGISRDYSGKGYTGIIAFMKNKSYREYLGADLTQPLDSGITYHVQFSFRLSSYSKISSGKMGLAFTKQKVKVHNDERIDLKPALVAMPDSGLVTKSGLWQTVSTDYVAEGGESFLVIGNFFSAAETPTYNILFNGNHEPMLAMASYFYIDDVIVQPQVQFIPDLPLVTLGDDFFEGDSVVTLKHVQFAYNSALLSKSSEPELQRVLHFLQEAPEVRIEIAGHTDDQGTDIYNLDLSKRRAAAVRQFLINNGIAPDRLTAKGYGKTEPLINQTDEGARSLNRRVEVRLMK